MGEEVIVRDGRELVIDHTILFQLCSDEGFYTALPPGSDGLIDLGRKAYHAAVTAAMDNTACKGCGTLRGTMAPLQNILGQRLAAIHTVQPALLEPLAQFIAEKRGFRPKPIILYYRSEGGLVRRLAF